MVPETVLMDQAGRVAQNVAGSAAQQGGGFIMNLLMAPIHTFANMGRSAFSGIMSWGIPAALSTAAIMFFTPHAIRPALSAIGQEGLADRLGNMEEGGAGKALLVAAGTGVVAGAGIGALGGAWNSLTGGSNSEANPQSGGARLGQGIGTALTFAAIGAVAIGALNRDGISHDAGGERDVTPPPAPRAANARQAAVN